MENNDNQFNNIEQNNMAQEPVVNSVPVQEIPVAPVESFAVPDTLPQETQPTVSVNAEVPDTPSEPAQNTVEQPLNNNTFIEKDKKVWPIVLLVVILALGGLFAYYYFVMTKPINVITKLVNSAYKDVEKAANSGSQTLNSLNMDSTLTFTSEDQTYSAYSGLNAKLSVGLDLKNKDKNLIDADIKLKDASLINMAVSFVGDKMYIDLKDAYTNVVYLEGENSFVNLDSLGIDTNDINNKKDNYLYLAKLFKDTILKNITQEKLTKKIMLKDINGKKVPVVEVIYKIDYAEYKRLHNSVINAILDDNKALKILSEESEENVSDIKEELIDERDNISEIDFDSDIDVVLDIDAFTNKLVYLNAKNKSDEVTYVDKNGEIGINIVEKSGDTADITIDKSENKVLADIKMVTGKSTQRFEVTVKANEMTTTSGDINVAFTMYYPNEVNKKLFNATGEFKVKVNSEVKTLDTTNAVLFNNLSPNDQQKFMSALESSMSLIQGAE